MQNAAFRPSRFIKLSVLLLATCILAMAICAGPVGSGTSGALQPVPGLTLQGESLAFTFGGVHRGPMPDLVRQPQVCRIEAVYRLTSAADQAAAFSFIAPSAEAVSVHVNGVEVPVTASAFQSPHAWIGRAPSCRPALLPGLSRAPPGWEQQVAVSYSQVLGAEEQGLAYFVAPIGEPSWAMSSGR